MPPKRVQKSPKQQKRAVKANLKKPTLAIRNRGQNSPVSLALSLPHQSPAIRFSDSYTSEKTAIASPYYLNEANFSFGSDDPGSLVADGTLFVACFRNALRAMLQWDPNPDHLTSVYTASFLGTGTSQSSTLLIPAGSSGNLRPTWFNHFSGPSPHGQILYCGEYQDRVGFWVDGTVMHPGIIATNSTVIVDYQLFLFDRTIWRQVADWSGSGIHNQGIEASGYYSLSYFEGNILDTTINVTISSSSGHMRHLPLPFLTQKADVIQSLRTNAVAVMVSCEASLLNNAGKIAGLQAPAGNSWVTFTQFSAVSGANDGVTMNLATGIYGYLKPTGPGDFEMDEPFQIESGVAITGYYSLIPAHDYLVVMAQTPSTATNTYPGGDCYATLCWGVELRTTDVWFVQNPPSISPVAFDADISRLRKMEQWFENPLHFSDITNFLRNAANTVGRGIVRAADLTIKYGPALAKLASMVAPMLA